MKAPTMRWGVPLWAWVPIALAIVAEAAWNALRAYDLGTHMTRSSIPTPLGSVSLTGMVLVMAACAVSLAQARAAWVAILPGPARQRVVAGIAAALLIAISITAGASHLLEAERIKMSDQSGDRSAFDGLEAEYKRKSTELDALGTPRPVDVIQAAINAVRIDAAVWRRSQQCSDISRDDTRAACEPILALYKERGAAARKLELAPEVDALRAKLAIMPRPKEPSMIETALANTWTVLMGLGIVMLATFGAVIFAKPMPVVPSPTLSQPNAVATAPTPPRGTRRKRVVVGSNVIPLRERRVIDAIRGNGGYVTSSQKLADLMGCSEGETSKRLSMIRKREPDLLRFEKVGKELRISLAKRPEAA